MKEINGDGSFTIIEQNWKWQVNGVTYCNINRNISYSATANLKFFRWSNGWALDGAASNTPSTPAVSETPNYPQIQNHNPMGVLDSVEVYENMIVIKGWVFDYDNTAENIDVQAYIDDGLGGQIGIGSTTANKGRPDVNNAYNGVGECHGFEAAFGSPSIGTFNVYVYAMNNVGEGTNQLIGREQVTVDVVKPPEKINRKL